MFTTILWFAIFAKYFLITLPLLAIFFPNLNMLVSIIKLIDFDHLTLSEVEPRFLNDSHLLTKGRELSHNPRGPVIPPRPLFVQLLAMGESGVLGAVKITAGWLTVAGAGAGVVGRMSGFGAKF